MGWGGDRIREAKSPIIAGEWQRKETRNRRTQKSDQPVSSVYVLGVSGIHGMCIRWVGNGIVGTAGTERIAWVGCRL